MRIKILTCNSIDIEDDIMEMRAEEQAQMAEAKITLVDDE